jgi:hypothetical protein
MYNKTFIPSLYSYNIINNATKKAGSLLESMIARDKYLKSKLYEWTTQELNYILDYLIDGIIMGNIYPVEEKDVDHCCMNIVGDEETVTPLSNYTLVNKTFRDLFIWAILINYIDMAKVLLANMNHRICAALIARKILMSYRDKYAIYDDKKAAYTQSMDYFEDYAIDCLTCCYKNNPNQACELVLRECGMFGNVTCLQVSIDLF